MWVPCEIHVTARTYQIGLQAEILQLDFLRILFGNVQLLISDGLFMSSLPECYIPLVADGREALSPVQCNF